MKLTREQVEGWLAGYVMPGVLPAPADVFARELLAAWDREAKLREALAELADVSARAVRLSTQHSDFKLYAMEPIHKAIISATRALGDTP